MNYPEILKYLPGIEPPIKHLTLKDKLKWTGIVLILFFALSQIIVWGIDPQAVQHFLFLETVLGSRMGSLITLGIGPIVTASIILQLLVGSGILKWNTGSRDGRMKFMGTQKLLAIFFCIFESFAFVYFGAIPPESGGITPILIMLQLTLGGLLIILMDEVVSKWGIGSGVSLFIAAGVSKTIMIRALNFVGAGSPTGLIPSSIMSFMSGRPLEGIVSLIPIFFTIIIFLIVTYGQSMKVEIPLAFGMVRGFSMKGFGYRHPLKFIYASNIPVILTAALLSNIEMVARTLYSKGITILGTFNADGRPISGLAYYLTPPRGHTLSDLIISWIYGVSLPPEAITWITYSIFLIGGSILFSVFWINTAGMDAKSVAKQLHTGGLGLPGFRRDIRIIERVLERYITPLAVMGGAFVGFLAAFADFTGALGTGTGILLTVMIIYRLYEDISKQHMEDLHPALRKFFE
ncbi:MAG: preprotein translocase subunit SecY [Candidatus Aenigmarchaeota archaeon]|nr:preprotein translocase subunit SecY [Candidatus Aenigmarchaeota archaeon]